MSTFGACSLFVSGNNCWYMPTVVYSWFLKAARQCNVTFSSSFVVSNLSSAFKKAKYSVPAINKKNMYTKILSRRCGNAEGRFVFLYATIRYWSLAIS